MKPAAEPDPASLAITLDDRPARPLEEAEPALPATPAAIPGESNAQNVVRAANWPQKLAAGMVDGAITVALTMGYAVVEFLELPEAEQSDTSAPLSGIDYVLDVASRYSMLLLGMFVAITLAATVYEALSVAILGRTVGQKVLGVRLIQLSGERPGFLRAVVRGLLVGLGLMLMGAGWLWAPFDRRRAGLHDKWTGLVLVEDPEPAPPAPAPPETPAPTPEPAPT